jgi:S1-C subfamily serine protease
MTILKTGVLSGALVLAAGAGAAIAPVAHGQAREREPLVRAMQIIGGDAHIGVEVRDADPKDSSGVVVDDVENDSPAEKAGLKKGDTIVEFDGERVRSVAQFRRLVQETAEGHTVPAVALRNGQRVTVSLTPERGRGMWDGEFGRLVRPAGPAAPLPPATAARPYLAPSVPGFEFSLRSNERRLGIMTESLTDQLSDYFGVKGGVLVRSVIDDSAAAKAGIKAGDVIVSVNGHHVDDPSDVTEELRRAPGDDFTLDVVRDHKTQTLKGKVESTSNRRRSIT